MGDGPRNLRFDAISDGDLLIEGESGEVRINSPERECCCTGCCRCANCCYGPGDCLFATLTWSGFTFTSGPSFLCPPGSPPCVITCPGYTASAKYVYCGCYAVGQEEVCAVESAVFLRADALHPDCSNFIRPINCNQPPTPNQPSEEPPSFERMPYQIYRCCQTGMWHAVYADTGNTDCSKPCAIPIIQTGCCFGVSDQCFDLTDPLGVEALFGCPCRQTHGNGCDGASIVGKLRHPAGTPPHCAICTVFATKTLTIDVFRVSCADNLDPQTQVATCTPRTPFPPGTSPCDLLTTPPIGLPHP